jgi:2-polyprenyl-6-methoxyphenol hydroxylase-like FAD-dependent oxidoreductase
MVIIAGGGIGGLTTAIALSKAGIDFAVYERAPELREAGAGIALAANALNALDLLGIGDAIRCGAIAGVQGGIKDPKGKALMAMPADEFTKRIGAVAVIHRAELLTTLLQRVDPGRLHLGRECTGFEQDAESVTARFRNGETVRGTALIGSDGLRSVIRTQLFGNRQPRYSGYTAWRAVVEFDHGLNPEMTETWGRGRRFGIVPMSRGCAYWFATNNEAEGQRDPEGRTREVLLQHFRGWHEPIEALIAAAPEGSILRNDIYDTDPLKQWGSGRIVLLGDAAHPMTPNLGQGGCQAIEDAVVLAACLKKNSDVAAALREYQSRRMPRTREIVLRSRSFGAIAQLENPVLRGIRNVLLRTAPKGLAAKQMKSLVGFEILTTAEKLLFDPIRHNRN